MAGPGTISSASPRKLRAVAPGHPAENDLGHLIDAPVEALIIGTVLSEGEPAYWQVRFLEVDDFGVERHRVVWRHIIQVADEVHPTMDEIYHQASVAKTLESFGGMEYLLELHGQAIPGIRLEGFARSIRDKRPSVGFGV